MWRNELSNHPFPWENLQSRGKPNDIHNIWSEKYRFQRRIMNEPLSTRLHTNPHSTRGDDVVLTTSPNSLYWSYGSLKQLSRCSGIIAYTEEKVDKRSHSRIRAPGRTEIGTNFSNCCIHFSSSYGGHYQTTSKESNNLTAKQTCPHWHCVNNWAEWNRVNPNCVFRSWDKILGNRWNSHNFIAFAW